MVNYKIFNNLFRYITVNGKLEGKQFSYISFEEEELNMCLRSNKINLQPNLISSKVYNIEIKKVDIKTTNFSSLPKLEEDVINLYIKEGHYDKKFDIDISESFNNIMNKIDTFSNFLYHKNRIGKPNTVLVLKEIYQRYYMFFSKINGIVENKFDKHQDKIVLINLNSLDSLTNTFIVFTDTNFLNYRYLKLKKLLYKTFNKNVDKKINYAIFNTGKNSKYSVGHIKIK